MPRTARSARQAPRLVGRSGNFDALGFLGWQPMGADLEDGDGNDIRSSAIDIANGLVKFGFEPNEANRFELSGSLYHDEGTAPPNANGRRPATDVDRDADVSTARLGWNYAPGGLGPHRPVGARLLQRPEITEDR